MPLQRLLIQNFQAHEKLKVEFDPGVTTIVGPSDVGKSAVIRALGWVSRNTPQGTAFIKDGEAGCTVKLYADEQVITRKRGRTGDNLYLLGDKEFKAFGTGVPEPISKLLNLNDVNFQGQHDSSFWLALSAGEVSRQLNAVVDLTIIDSTLEEINRRYRAAMQVVDTRKDMLKKAKEDRKALDWVAEAQIDLTSVESRAATHTAASASAVLLRSTVNATRDQYGRWQTAQARLEQLKKVGKAAAVLLKAGTDQLRLLALLLRGRGYRKTLDRGAPDLQPLSAVIVRYNSWSGKAKDLRRVLYRLRPASETRLLDRPDISGLTTRLQAYDGTKKVKRDLSRQLSLSRVAADVIADKQGLLQTAEAKLQELTKGRCPVCGRPMNGNADDCG